MVSVLGWAKPRGLGWECQSRGYLQGEHRPQPRGAAPGTQPSCQSWSLQLQQGMKYLQARVKPLHVPLAGTWPHKALPNYSAQPGMSSNKPGICPCATSWHLLCRNLPFVWDLKYPAMYWQILCLSIIKEQESSPEFPVPIVMSPPS